VQKAQTDQTVWRRLSGSLWFVPAMMVLASIGLAIALVELDGILEADIDERWPRLFGAGVDGSRELLAAVAGSMITVAGVVFSVTIVALSLGASAYSPRVLRTFMSDRPTQVVLGAFVGVFSYCLVVLRTIRSGDDDVEQFVPRLAVAGGILFALVAIGMLVFFIHHLATAIQASSILERITRTTLRAIDELFPENLGDGVEEPVPQAAEGSAWTPIAACQSGYIVSVDNDGLLAFARAQGRVLRMDRTVGDFVIDGCPLASLQGSAAVDEDTPQALGRLYVIRRQRSIDQDAAFGMQEIVDVAVKALSPSENDPTTAIMCIDRLTQLLVRVASRRVESPLRRDGAELRVIAHGPTFAGLADLSYDAVRNEAHGNPTILLRLLWSVAQVGSATTNPDRRRILMEHARRIREAARSTVAEPAQLAEILRRMDALRWSA
jgi:uncharacterized membrane protein